MLFLLSSRSNPRRLVRRRGKSSRGLLGSSGYERPATPAEGLGCAIHQIPNRDRRERRHHLQARHSYGPGFLTWSHGNSRCSRSRRRKIEHDLPITKQAEVLRISRGSVYYLLPAAPGAGRRCCGNPHGSLTQADAPLSNAENLFRTTGPTSFHSPINDV